MAILKKKIYLIDNLTLCLKTLGKKPSGKYKSMKSSSICIHLLYTMTKSQEGKNN